jgi:hypothetical protein
VPSGSVGSGLRKPKKLVRHINMCVIPLVSEDALFMLFFLLVSGKNSGCDFYSDWKFPLWNSKVPELLPKEDEKVHRTGTTQGRKETGKRLESKKV